MRRREFIGLLGGVAAAWPLAARAQEPGRAYRVGGLSVNPREAPIIVAMFDELRKLGFVEGQNLTIDWRIYEPHGDLAAQFEVIVKGHPDVIYAGGPASIRAAQKTTTTIPILGLTDDMVGSGLVNSLAHPGGNTTGVSMLAGDLDGKRQEILIELVPGLHRMGALTDSNTTGSPQLQALENAARARGVELSIHRITKPDEITAAIDAAKVSGAEALNVLELGTPLGLPTNNYDTRRGTTASGHLSMARSSGGRRLLCLWATSCRNLSRPHGAAIGQAFARRQARRFAGPAADQVRPGDQYQSR